MSRLLSERTLWLGAGLWAGAIFVASSIPRTEQTAGLLPGGGIDKPLHLIAYLILAGLLLLWAVIDHVYARKGWAPGWYPSLRWPTWG